MLVHLDESVQVVRQLGVFFLDDFVDLGLCDLQLLLELLHLSLLDANALYFFSKLGLIVLNGLDSLSEHKLLRALLVMQVLLSSFHFLVELQELSALGQEGLVVGVANLHMHLHQIVHKAEDFEELSETMLAKETNLNRLVEKHLAEVVVAYSEAT